MKRGNVFWNEACVSYDHFLLSCGGGQAFSMWNRN